MSRLVCTRLFTRVVSHRVPVTWSRSVRSDQVIPTVSNISRSPCLLTRLYSTNSKDVSDGDKEYTRKIILASAVGLAVALGAYSVRRAVSESSMRTVSPSANPQSFVTNYASPEELRLAIQELRGIFTGEHIVETDPDLLRLYGSSENSYHPTSPHSVVVRMHSTEDVVKVVNISRKYRVPITAYSGATSLEGHFSGVRARAVHWQVLWV
jgi:hypothetical protein